jgi:hypothetical protein
MVIGAIGRSEDDRIWRMVGGKRFADSDEASRRKIIVLLGLEIRTQRNVTRHDARATESRQTLSILLYIFLYPTSRCDITSSDIQRWTNW